MLKALETLERHPCEKGLPTRGPLLQRTNLSASSASSVCHFLIQYIRISLISPPTVSQKIAPRASTQSPVRRRR